MTGHIHDQTTDSPIGPLRKVVPWIALGVILMLVFSWYGAYREGQAAWKAASSKPKPSEVATAAAPAAKKPGEPKKAEAAAQTPASQVIVVSDVTLRKDPSSSAEPLRDLKTGEKLTLVGQLGPWYKVTDDSGRTGWVSASDRYTKVVAGK